MMIPTEWEQINGVNNEAQKLGEKNTNTKSSTAMWKPLQHSITRKLLKFEERTSGDQRLNPKKLKIKTQSVSNTIIKQIEWQ